MKSAAATVHISPAEIFGMDGIIVLVVMGPYAFDWGGRVRIRGGRGR